MTRTAILTWTVAALFAVGIGIWVVHSQSARSHACARGSSNACTQAKKNEDGAILMGALGAVFILMAGGAAVAAARR